MDLTVCLPYLSPWSSWCLVVLECESRDYLFPGRGCVRRGAWEVPPLSDTGQNFGNLRPGADGGGISSGMRSLDAGCLLSQLILP